METPKHSASELRAMLKEHKASMPRLSAKKAQLIEYAGKIGLFKTVETPPTPPEATPVELKKKLKPALPAVEVSVPKNTLPAVLKKPEAKKSEAKVPAPVSAKKSFSESAKGGLAAYTSFLAEGKARGMSHADAVAAWKSRK